MKLLIALHILKRQTKAKIIGENLRDLLCNFSDLPGMLWMIENLSEICQDTLMMILKLLQQAGLSPQWWLELQQG
ncbi:MAG: hypothetical protein F6J95_022980 [Leptolyngbya sp. SIO1E4]|nr:hypothetical protein [Leptolyngbya sp. SIO1E4]